MSKVKQIADQCGLTGLKRIVYYVVAPFVVAVIFARGFVLGVAHVITKHQK